MNIPVFPAFPQDRCKVWTTIITLGIQTTVEGLDNHSSGIRTDTAPDFVNACPLASGRRSPGFFLAPAKINIVSTAAMHTPLPRWVLVVQKRFD
jgi:hypothetical protein